MADQYHRHVSKRVNLGEFETEEDILDAIEQSRRITRLIISAVQKGSKFEVSQILEHYGLAMTSRLHFKVTNIVMEQWFSLMGIEDEEQIWNILKKNPYAMNKLRANAGGGTMVLSDMLTEWELGIGALQSKIIRRIAAYCEHPDASETQNDDNKEENDTNKQEKSQNEDSNTQNEDKTATNGNADTDQKEDK